MVTKKPKQSLFIDQEEFSLEDIISTLKRLGLYEKAVDDLILQKEVRSINITKEDIDFLKNKFKTDHNLANEEEYKKALQNKGVQESTLENTMTLSMQVSRFREEKWGTRANTLYLSEKDKYDVVVYHRLECSSFCTMQEVYFRIKDGETTWETMAKQFNPRNKEVTSIIGPIGIDKIEEEVINTLRTNRVGKINTPIKIEGNYVLTQLISISPTKFNEEMKEIVLISEYNKWLRETQKEQRTKVRIES